MKELLKNKMILLFIFSIFLLTMYGCNEPNNVLLNENDTVNETINL